MLKKDAFHDIDFNALYRDQCRRSSFGARAPADWDRRAEQRSRRDLTSDYNQAFLDRVNFDGLRTALDIGCGVGNLAIPLARRLRKVTAIDFSREMLRHLDAHARRAGVSNIEMLLLSWTDSWKGVPPADLVICSRALGVDDLRGALEKMNRQARKRCYVTLHAGGSYLGPDVMERLDQALEPRPDYIYAVNILYQMGIRARVDFLRSRGGVTYGSASEFLEAVRWRIGPLSTKEQKRLREFYRTLPRDEQGRAQYRHDFEWAMLGWEKK
ncbi:MAG TPA: class I SAM-dependent methyltransferase [Kiritimatiellia bacterium]|nr:class I SAM-dependent methyltransferase [Kiritimatiellia bacterium]HSA18549.1 class I SAM-dependent methyltransferase [Kiritimatiellia bacterium]